MFSKASEHFSARALALGAAVALSVLPLTAKAQEHRELGAHVHGWGALNIAMDGADVALDLHAPGADIVGFEHDATLAEEKALVADAIARLGRPLELFTPPDEAQCTVAQANAEFSASHEGEHAEGEGEEHEEGHAEFTADYLLSCANPSALSELQFRYFDAFPHAEGLHVQLADQQGTRAYEVKRAAQELDLSATN